MTSVPTIFVLHGALGAASQMAPVADALSALGTVHAFDWPGHGTRPLRATEAFSITAFVDALEQHVKELGGVRPIAFGHSMGGYVALALESRAPGTFASIVTLGTKFDWTPANAVREVARMDAAMIVTKVPRFAQALEARHRDAGGWHLVLERTIALLHENSAAPLLNASAFGRIAIPVRVAVGTRDDTVNWEETVAAAAAMQNATRVQLPDISHPIERVPPDVVVKLVSELL